SRRAWDALDDLGRAAVEVAEGYADGRAGPDALRAARLACRGCGGGGPRDAAAAPPAGRAPDAAPGAAGGPGPGAAACAPGRPGGGRAAQAALLRDIFGDAVRPAGLDRVWLTSTVVSLAREMYESREFTAMPTLADALQDAGCDNPDILDHCRGPGPHVRGCWV